MKINKDIKSNAIDSFNEALEKFKKAQQGDNRAYKFVISNISHAIELILKIYLQNLNENLIYSKSYKEVKKRSTGKGIDLLAAFHELESEKFDFEIPIKGQSKPHTVTVSEVLDIVKLEKCPKTNIYLVSEEFIKDINGMKAIRNSIEHFEFELTPKDVRLCIGRLIQSLDEFTDIFSLFNLKEQVRQENVEIFEILIDEYQASLMEVHLDISESKDALFSKTRPKYQMFIEWKQYECDECGNVTVIPAKDSPTGYRCKFCGNEESGEIEVSCDTCYSLWPKQEMVFWEEGLEHVCPRCRNPEAYK